MTRRAIVSDVIDELVFISDMRNNYKVSQRQTAERLLQAYKGTQWDPEVEIHKVIDVLNNRHVEIPKLPKVRKKVGCAS